ncbi:MAG: DUF2264 domain-containing protein [Chthoniobacterales bacterium]
MSDCRNYWVSVATRLSLPLLPLAAEGKLRAVMPREHDGKWDSLYPQMPLEQLAYFEGFARLLSGIAPWLELDEPEALPFAEYARAGLKSIFDSSSPDFYDCSTRKAIVDVSFLAQAIIRAPRALWEPLDASTKQNILQAFRKTRVYLAHPSNWLLFAAIIEAALYLCGAEDWDRMRIDYAVRQHLQWYKGDGFYGDGEFFHADYYNSFVIQPMLVDIMTRLWDLEIRWERLKETVMHNARRYAAIQERFISPEGTFPAIGRSGTYRAAAFQALAQMALLHELPGHIKPAQVREALTAVTRRTIEAPGTFDDKGWLKIGICGSQPALGENYICTGSLYLCSNGLLPLGLPASDPFWSDPSAPWSGKQIWGGENVPYDPEASMPA